MPAQAGDIHTSPQRVFEAYRTATNKKDWRTVYDCYSPRTREALPLNILLACEDAGQTPEIVAMLKKHHVDQASIETRYFDEYQKKHGIDLKKVSVDKLPPQDQALIQSVFASLLVDRAAFFHDAMEVLNKKNDGSTSPVRALTDVSVKGDSATGQSTTTLYGLEKRPGSKEKKVADVVPATYHFVRVNGKWYVEG